MPRVEDPARRRRLPPRWVITPALALKRGSTFNKQASRVPACLHQTCHPSPDRDQPKPPPLRRPHSVRGPDSKAAPSRTRQAPAASTSAFKQSQCPTPLRAGLLGLWVVSAIPRASRHRAHTSTSHRGPARSAIGRWEGFSSHNKFFESCCARFVIRLGILTLGHGSRVGVPGGGWKLGCWARDLGESGDESDFC